MKKLFFLIATLVIGTSNIAFAEDEVVCSEVSIAGNSSGSFCQNNTKKSATVTIETICVRILDKRSSSRSVSFEIEAGTGRWVSVACLLGQQAEKGYVTK